jgi:hypothetical protein
MDDKDKKELTALVGSAVKTAIELDRRSNGYVDNATCRATRKELTGTLKTVTGKMEAVHNIVLNVQAEQRTIGDDLRGHLTEHELRKEISGETFTLAQMEERAKVTRRSFWVKAIGLGLSILTAVVLASFFIARMQFDQEALAKTIGTAVDKAMKKNGGTSP